MFKLNKKSVIIPFTIVLILLISFFMSRAATNNLKIHFIDVGQADSIFIQLPDNRTMLIDGGNNDDSSLIINYIKGLKEQEVSKIDYLIGTHPHEDHIGGLDDIIKTFEIGKIYLPKVNHNTKTFEDLLSAIKNKGLKISTARAGDVIFANHNLNAKILSPGQDFYDELNNYSVVIRLTYGKTAYLFTGDAEDVVENQLVNNNMELKANVLKVGHHGSNSSTTESFLEAVLPQYAVISVGKNNRYGHPSQVVINRLKRHKVKVLRTDSQGTIVASSNGNKIEFNKKELAVNRDKVKNNGVYIASVNLGGSVESIVIKNGTGNAVNLSDWKLVSETGGQEYIFPQGTEIPAKGKLKIVSGRGAKGNKPGVILWNNSYIWNNDGDPAVLYNSSGQLVSRFPEEE